MGKWGLDASDSGQEPVAGSYAHDNEHSCSARSWVFIYQL